MSVAQILQQMAESAGRKQMARGQLLGQTVSDIGQIPGQIMDARAQQRIDQAKLARQQQQDAMAADTYQRRVAGETREDAARAEVQRQKDIAHQVAIVYHNGSPNDPTTNDLEGAIAKAKELGAPELIRGLKKQDLEDRLAGQDELVSGAPGSFMRNKRTGLVVPGSEIPEAPPKVGTEGYEVYARSQQLQAPTPMAPGDAGPPTPGMPRAQADLQAYDDQRAVKASETHSPAYKEFQDYKASGGTLDFNGYQTMDANRRRSVTVNNAPTDNKMIDDAARNILANPRDLTSIKNITTLRGDQRIKLYNRLKELDPTFNSGNIDRQIKFIDSYENPAGKPAMNRQSMNNILMHSSDLSDVNQEYRRSNVRLVNTPLNKIRSQYSADYEKYATTVAVLKDEISLYFAGGYAPTKEQGTTWTKILNDETTPNQVEAFAKQIIHVGLRRASTHNSDFKSVMGYDDPNLITPDAVAAGVHLGLGEAMKPFGSGGTLGGKPPTTPSTTKRIVYGMDGKPVK